MRHVVDHITFLGQKKKSFEIVFYFFFFWGNKDDEEDIKNKIRQAESFVVNMFEHTQTNSRQMLIRESIFYIIKKTLT